MVQQRIIIIRHGERVDNVFGTDWIERCFDAEGNYTPETANHPVTLPDRDSIKDFLNDSPITQNGSHQAYLLGTGLKSLLHSRPYKVYSSPALRSIQTSMEILRGMGDNLTKIAIDPCLYEWPKWSPLGFPIFIPSSDLASCKDNKIDTNYQPTSSINDIDPDESVETFYSRSYEWINKILSMETCDLVLVAHGSSLDALSRQLTCGKSRSKKEMFDLSKRSPGGIPYLSVCTVEKNLVGSWKIMNPHGVNKSFCPVKTFVDVE